MPDLVVVLPHLDSNQKPAALEQTSPNGSQPIPK